MADYTFLSHGHTITIEVNAKDSSQWKGAQVPRCGNAEVPCKSLCIARNGESHASRRLLSPHGTLHTQEIRGRSSKRDAFDKGDQRPSPTAPAWEPTTYLPEDP